MCEENLMSNECRVWWKVGVSCVTDILYPMSIVCDGGLLCHEYLV